LPTVPKETGFSIGMVGLLAAVPSPLGIALMLCGRGELGSPA
jgi:hypothetical protein